ncbi:MAG TPA: hypothetical protein VGH99_13650 [Pseudonocardia sp.]|jgi:hypothetical protein
MTSAHDTQVNEHLDPSQTAAPTPRSSEGQTQMQSAPTHETALDGGTDAGTHDAGTTHGAAATHDGGAGAARSHDAGVRDNQPDALFEQNRVEDYQHRFNDLKGGFVDDPKKAMHDVDSLVAEVLDELEKRFRRQHKELTEHLANEGSSTEDLRNTFGNYRTFLDRLLSL